MLIKEKTNYDIKCRFCNIKLGETGNLQDIVDTRCDNCQVLYGKFKDMEYKFFHTLGGTDDEFKAVLEKAEYKKPFFDAEIEKIKKAKKKEFGKKAKKRYNINK